MRYNELLHFGYNPNGDLRMAYTAYFKTTFTLVQAINMNIPHCAFAFAYVLEHIVAMIRIADVTLHIYQ